MKLDELVTTSRRVAEAAGRRDKTGALAELLRRLGPEEVEIGVDYLAGRLRQGRIGVGWAALSEARGQGSPSDAPSLSLVEVDRAFGEIAARRGAGSAAERRRVLGALLLRATAAEQDFLVRLVHGELRQGAEDGVMIEAVAAAAGLPAAALRRAVMLAGEAATVAKAALTVGAAALDRFRLELCRPIQPMLAQTAGDVDEALDTLGEAALEWKLDGARLQLHKSAGEVRLFSRSLHEVTLALPEIVEVARALPARSLILDGEAIALTASGAPQPFQVTMRRFGRGAPGPGLRAALPLRAFFFDALHLDGADLLDLPARERAAALREALPESLRVPRLELGGDEADHARGRAFVDEALARGHEGVMAKALDAPYEAGRRGKSWLKVKRAHTLDLVVLAVEWGSGRRRGWLSNLHLGARGPAPGDFVMLGKTFKGMTDEMLAWQTERLRALEIDREGHVVHVAPELVVEIAFDGIQQSPHYPGGLALRFARVKRYREDKRAADAATIDEVRAIFARQNPAE